MNETLLTEQKKQFYFFVRCDLGAGSGVEGADGGWEIFKLMSFTAAGFFDIKS